MRYEYECSACDTQYTCNIPMDDYKIPQPCPECGVENAKIFKPTLNMIFRGDGWSTKNERIKRQMKSKNRKLDQRQHEMKNDTNVGGRLAPNVDGERVDTWAEAQSLAKSKGKDTSSYEAMVHKEKKGK